MVVKKVADTFVTSQSHCSTFGQFRSLLVNHLFKRIRIQDVAEALPIALLLFLLGKRSGGVDFGETRKTFDQSDFVKRGAFARKPKPQGENQYHAGGHAG